MSLSAAAAVLAQGDEELMPPTEAVAAPPQPARQDSITSLVNSLNVHSQNVDDFLDDAAAKLGSTAGTGGGERGEFDWMTELGDVDEHHEDYELSLFVKKVIDEGLYIKAKDAVKWVANAETIADWADEEGKKLKNLVGTRHPHRILTTKIDSLIHDCNTAKEEAENGFALANSTQELFEEAAKSESESIDNDDPYDKKDSKALRMELAEKETAIEMLEELGSPVSAEQTMIKHIFQQAPEDIKKEMKAELTKVHTIVKGHAFQKMSVLEKKLTLSITNTLFYESLKSDYVYDPTATKAALVNMTTLIGGEEMPGENVFSSLNSDGFKALASVIDSSIKSQTAPTQIANLRAEHKTLKTALAMKLYDEQEAKEEKKLEKEKAAAKKRMEQSPIGSSSKKPRKK